MPPIVMSLAITYNSIYEGLSLVGNLRTSNDLTSPVGRESISDVSHLDASLSLALSLCGVNCRATVEGAGGVGVGC